MQLENVSYEHIFGAVRLTSLAIANFASFEEFPTVSTVLLGRFKYRGRVILEEKRERKVTLKIVRGGIGGSVAAVRDDNGL